MVIVAAASIVRRGRLKWFGYFERKDRNDWVSDCRNFEVPGPKGRGRSRKTWGECVRHDLCSEGLRAEWAQDKTRWRGLIGGNRPTCVSMEKNGRKTMMMMINLISHRYY